jgi:hypothetical protein
MVGTKADGRHGRFLRRFGRAIVECPFSLGIAIVYEAELVNPLLVPISNCSVFGKGVSMFKRNLCVGFVGMLLAAATPALAIEGFYTVEGRNPGAPQSYKGEAQIKQTGRTYTVVWKIGEGAQIGTGVMLDNILSVVFTAPGPARPGLAVFSVTNDKITSGVWTSLGSQTVAEETWAPADRH